MATMYYHVTCSLQVLVVIDVSLKEQGLPTDAYYAVEEVHDVRNDYLYLKQMHV